VADISSSEMAPAPSSLGQAPTCFLTGELLKEDCVFIQEYGRVANKQAALKLLEENPMLEYCEDKFMAKFVKLHNENHVSPEGSIPAGEPAAEAAAAQLPTPPNHGFSGSPVTEDSKLPAVARAAAAAAPSAIVKVKPTKPTYIKAPDGYTPRFSKDKDHLIEINPEDIADEDVLCGRVNKGSTHPGNVEFLRVIKFHRNAYQGMGAQHGKKTKLRNFIVDKDFKGRFIGMEDNGTHYLLTEEKARTKVSQALHEKREAPRA
jgi:hypothetical protein